MKPFVFVGIDAGLNGAISVLDERLSPILLKDMPVLYGGKEIDVRGLYDMLVSLSSKYELVVAIEECRYTPKMINEKSKVTSVMSAFKFGKTYQSVVAVAEILNFRRTYVRPEIWKGEYFLFGKDKEQSVETACQFFPSIAGNLKYKLSGKTTWVFKDGRAEATLIAHYGWKRFNNLKPESKGNQK